MSHSKWTPGIITFAVSAAVLAKWGAIAQGAEPAEAKPRPAAADARPDRWKKAVEDRAKRGTLEDVRQNVRGDTGKWSDEPRLQHAPPIQSKPRKLPLDEWADQLLEQEFQLDSDDDNWLLFRTRQLDDNDRIWVERIARRGNRLTVVAHQAVWQGRYQKNFTGHVLLGVNLGQLEPGTYQAKWIIKPLIFNKFDDPARRLEAWPDDERPDEKQPTELRVTFTVAPAQ